MISSPLAVGQENDLVLHCGLLPTSTPSLGTRDGSSRESLIRAGLPGDREGLYKKIKIHYKLCCFFTLYPRAACFLLWAAEMLG